MRIRFRLSHVLLFTVILATIMSGCLADKTSTPSTSSPPAILVDYQRTGGIVGFSDRVVIFDNGITLVSSREHSTEIILNRTELDQLDAIFSTSMFFELEGNYTSARSGADLIQYHISYRGTIVNTEDTAIPHELEPVIEEMNRILSDGMSSGPAATMLPRIMT